MTIDEIVKAWEKTLATGDAPVGEHWSCGGVVTTKLAKETHDMLTRQKAEIERLKAEAIKEFTEEYKDHIKSFTGMFSPQLGFTVSLDAVLNAVDFVCEKMTKEMVGADK